MGIIYESIGQYEHATHVFKQCLGQLKDSYRDSEVLTNTYDYLCQTLYECGKYQEELNVAKEWEKCIQERIQKARKPRQSFLGTYIACHCNKALALTKLDKYEEAEQEIKQAETLLEEQNTPLGKYRVFLVKSHYALGKGEAQQALAYYDSLQSLNLKAGGDIKLLHADILAKMGKHDEAARMFRSLYLGKDSTYTRDMRMQLDELNTLYKVEELKIEGKLQRSRFMIGIGALLLIGLLFFTIYRFRASLKLAEEHEKLEQSYKELKIANQKAEESSKMKTNFIQQISHEIRTPLNILSGFTQIITTPGMELDDATRTDINNQINENTNRITGLVNKMLELSDTTSQAVIEREDDVPAVQIAAQAAEDSGINNAANITFDLQIAPNAEATMLHTNLAQSTRALVLLLDNAMKFISEPNAPASEGTVRLIVSQIDEQTVCFNVEDTGIGVPVKEAEHIFDEFVQLDDYYDGTGIGLTVARSIARRLGGDITLDTTYTPGARFIFTLPLT
jgi:signal transduction histidine kinase